MHSRHPSLSRIRTAVVTPHRLPSHIRACLVALAALAVLGARRVQAQHADSARVGVKAPAYDTATRVVPRPPLSPRRAFLYSLVLPGYGQSILGRPTAGAIFALAEAIGLTMLRESNAELQEARRLRGDSLVVIGYDAGGTPIRAASTYNDDLINIRRGHREDWIAALLANHFFAGADAYVAANLWDLPAQVAVRQTDHGTVVAARLRW